MKAALQPGTDLIPAHLVLPKQKRPRIAGTIQGAAFESGSNRVEFTAGVAVLQRAFFLDRLADAELQHGHGSAAEFLSRRAAELREGAR